MEKKIYYSDGFELSIFQTIKHLILGRGFRHAVTHNKQSAHTSFMYHHYPGPQCASLYDMILRQLALILDKMSVSDITLPEKGINAKELYERFPISEMLDSPPGSPGPLSPREFPPV